MTRQRFDSNELLNLLSNAHGIDVRVWIVDDEGVFQGIVFDSHSCNRDWEQLISDHPSPFPTGVEA